MHPDEVTWITDHVAVTNFVSAHDKTVLQRHQVSAVLCLDRGLQGTSAEERGVATVRTVHLVDGANEMVVFKEAVETLAELIDKYRRVVVHCRAGRSRSIAVLAAYLRKTRNLDVEETLALVKEKREAAVAPELVRLVEDFEG